MSRRMSFAEGYFPPVFSLPHVEPEYREARRASLGGCASCPTCHQPWKGAENRFEPFSRTKPDFYDPYHIPAPRAFSRPSSSYGGPSRREFDSHLYGGSLQPDYLSAGQSRASRLDNYKFPNHHPSAGAPLNQRNLERLQASLSHPATPNFDFGEVADLENPDRSRFEPDAPLYPRKWDEGSAVYAPLRRPRPNPHRAVSFQGIYPIDQREREAYPPGPYSISRRRCNPSPTLAASAATTKPKGSLKKLMQSMSSQNRHSQSAIRLESIGDEIITQVDQSRPVTPPTKPNLMYEHYPLRSTLPSPGSQFNHW